MNCQTPENSNLGQAACESLARECSVLSRYLVALPPDDALTEAYADFHRQRRVEGAGSTRPFDRFSLALLRAGPLGARVVDAYVSRFRRKGPAFEKLVVMLALLECRPRSAAVLARPYPGGAVRVVVALVLRGLGDALMLVISIAILAPLHLLQRAASREGSQ